MQEIEDKWQRLLQGAICATCDWSYLLSPGEEMPVCPHCYQATISPLTEDDLGQISAPELVVPFTVPA